MRYRKQFLAALIGVAAAVGSAQVLSQPSTAGGYGPGYGPSMMHGYGYGPGYGMGPGGMRGFGPGGYGMGPGMMYGYGRGGYGMGPGMMWGYGPGYGAGYGLNLTDEQRSKMAEIQQDLQRKQWDLMGKMRAERVAAYDGEDEAAARKTYKNIEALREQMFNNRLAAQKQIDAVLTKEQRQKLRGN